MRLKIRIMSSIATYLRLIKKIEKNTQQIKNCMYLHS